ncbi:hypothetical protein THAOC_31691 [Thalassiosira oceanica]|uniref:Uncharacterized protein n=1 Tax=Thalassiosira oceanica TaxID=159749 RepID=K0RKJ0_THAOC|nr:hypothetical protein THAOC_31691 [Thalassiosira oceanica]|eukprot:EJK49436.1 hypothetical protein THAOC_31691 [Thalassiosira oceanica]
MRNLRRRDEGKREVDIYLVMSLMPSKLRADIEQSKRRRGLEHLAADQGEAPALRLLFKIHENGHLGQEQSETLAFEYLKQAADKGCLISQSEIATGSHETITEPITNEDALYYATLACSPRI